MKHKIKDILNTPFVDLECVCKDMENKQEIMRLLEGIAINAGMTDRKSTRLNSSHSDRSRMPSSA